MRSFPPIPLLVALLLSAVAPAVAQNFCDDPPALTVLTGVGVSVTGTESEGFPTSYAWYVTPPGSSVPARPTTAGPWCAISPDTPGLWSIALVVGYEHETTGGETWSATECITIKAASVVASVGLSSTRISTEEEIQLIGNSSRWAPGVVPDVEWLIDGQSLGACNGGPPPTSPDDISCNVQGSWYAPGWHTAGLRLTDPVSGDTSLATADFEIYEIVPLSVDFSWNPVEPDPGQLVLFSAMVTPSTPELDFISVTWDFGDGNSEPYDSCPPPWYHTCLEFPYSGYASDGWYTATLTIETAEETASQSHQIGVGDPVPPPDSSFTPSPAAPLLLESTSLVFDGDCEGVCSWQWNFGDGSQSFVESPNHAWAVPGTYTVTLLVTNQSGSDSFSTDIDVSNCWHPITPTQQGICHGGPVFLTASPGNAWLWSTGATDRTASATLAGSYWVDVENGPGCWGHATANVVLNNCGSPTGDANLDGDTDAGDLAAMIPELTDGDGDTVVGAGGGDLTAPGGDATGDARLRADDVLTVIMGLLD